MFTSWKLALAGVGLVVATGYAVAQMAPGEHSMHGPMGDMSNDGKGPMQGHHRMMQEMQKRMQGMPALTA